MTIVEQVLARVEVVIAAAGIATTERENKGPIPAQSLPMVQVKRGSIDYDALGAGVLRHQIGIRIDLIAAHSNRETALDDLHARVHAALMADPTLNNLVAGLRPASADEPEAMEGDPPVSRMTVRYQATTATRMGNLSVRA